MYKDKSLILMDYYTHSLQVKTKLGSLWNYILNLFSFFQKRI